MRKLEKDKLIFLETGRYKGVCGENRDNAALTWFGLFLLPFSPSYLYTQSFYAFGRSLVTGVFYGFNMCIH